MHLVTRGLSIVFNGEIYNHKELRRELEQRGHSFSSNSDTEVLLVAYAVWGKEIVARLNGMFAFAIYDAQNGEVFLARDRAGEKPLFYRVDGNSLYFASELKALLAHPKMPRQIDPTALGCYLSMGFVPGDQCILQGFRKLPAAHAMIFDVAGKGQVQLWRYWQVPKYEDSNDKNADESALIDELETLFEESVKRQLVADVPVGVLLSGGVDSSLTTAMATRVSRRVKTFTARFPGFDPYDETKHARLVAHHFGTEHIELEAGFATPELLPILARQFDEPMVDSSMIPTYLLCKLVREHCAVALGGDGGDELFGGYGHYSQLLLQRARFKIAPLSLRKKLSNFAGLLPIGFKGRNWMQGVGSDLETALPLSARHFDSKSRLTLLETEMAEAISHNDCSDSIWLSRVPQSDDLIQRATHMDFENYLPDDVLVKVDRASMLNSLEVRAPWLDFRLIEFAFSKVPSRFKASTLDRKILPKMLAKRVLPSGFDTQRKQGFSIPLAEWLRGNEWGDYFRNILLSSQGTIFNKRFIMKLLNGHLRGRANSERLFAVVLFELWRREYEIYF